MNLWTDLDNQLVHTPFLDTVFIIIFFLNNGQVHNNPGVCMFLYAWSITEMIRYSFYAGGLLHMTPGVLTWLRYTLFIILYPIGVTVSNFIYYIHRCKYSYTLKRTFLDQCIKIFMLGQCTNKLSTSTQKTYSNSSVSVYQLI